MVKQNLKWFIIFYPVAGLNDVLSGCCFRDLKMFDVLFHALSTKSAISCLILMMPGTP
jgi:hypothetical protein